MIEELRFLEKILNSKVIREGTSFADKLGKARGLIQPNIVKTNYH